jgi:hypothetical protein
MTTAEIALALGGRPTMRIERHSPSSLNLFAASSAMFVLEKVLGCRHSVGARAHRGAAVEDGATAGLLDPNKPLAECQQVALHKYDVPMALAALRQIALRCEHFLQLSNGLPRSPSPISKASTGPALPRARLASSSGESDGHSAGPDGGFLLQRRTLWVSVYQVELTAAKFHRI